MNYCVSNPIAGIYRLDSCEHENALHVLPQMEMCFTNDSKIIAFDSGRTFKLFSDDAMACLAENVFWLEKDVWHVQFQRDRVFFQFPHGIASSFFRLSDKPIAWSIITVQRWWRRRMIGRLLDFRVFSRARVSQETLASRFRRIAGRTDLDLDDLVFNHILFIR